MPGITFAVVGRDEADSLALPLRLAFEASREGDEVVFVDSASRDGSADVAAALGASVIRAPAGKGRAMAAAWHRARGDHICFLDADVLSMERNVAVVLRDLVEVADPDLAIADFDEPGRRRAVTPAIYRPLRAALFGDLAGGDAPSPLSGFRAVRTARPMRPLPPGYGAEVHLELEVAVTGGRIVRGHAGRFSGKLREYRNVAAIAADVATAILDAAEAHGRLDRDRRPEWDAWVQPIVDHLRVQPPIDADATAHTAALLELGQRALPPSGCVQASDDPSSN
jgi:glucosyl-3-phosphoglycerate synthase